LSQSPLQITQIPPTNPVAIFNTCFESLPRDPSLCTLLPRWQDFDPIMVPRALTNLSIIECSGDSIADYRQILMGEEMKELSGGNKTGMRLWDAFTPASREARFAALQHCIDTREVMLSIADLPYANRDFLQVYRGSFPFCDDEARVSHIAIVIAQVEKN